FYAKQKQSRAPETLSVSVVPFPGLVIPIVRNPGADIDIVDESLAFFGQGTFHVTPSLRLIAGGRYTTDRLSLDRYDYATPANPF
ncbi:MAG: TonB-dependent receptor, partial [bacterium]|nr:TonB-dependent receptor [bacterium]